MALLITVALCVQHHMYVLIFLLTNVSQKIDAL